MPTRKITDLFAERVKPPKRGRVEYFDASFGSLALRVTSGGHKSWSLFYRAGGRLRRFTLGNFPALKPGPARREASRILERVAEGGDPVAEKKAQRDVRPPEEETFAAVVPTIWSATPRKTPPHPPSWKPSGCWRATTSKPGRNGP